MQVSQDASRRYSRSRSRSRSLPRKTRAVATYRGRSTISRILKNPNYVYRFSRTATWQCGYNGYSGFTTVSGGVVYGQGIGFNWTLGGPIISGSASSPGLQVMPNVTEFTALFDQYRIDNVKIKVFYTNNISNATGAVSTFQQIALPTGQFCTDYDDSVPPSSQGELLQRPETKLLQFNTNGPLVFNVPKPEMAQTVNAQTGINSVAAKNGWIDCGQTDVNNYGWKVWLEQFGSNTAGGLQQGYFQFYFTYDLSFKGVR